MHVRRCPVVGYLRVGRIFWFWYLGGKPDDSREEKSYEKQESIAHRKDDHFHSTISTPRMMRQWPGKVQR